MVSTERVSEGSLAGKVLTDTSIRKKWEKS